MSTSGTRAKKTPPGTGPLPLFGVEIEIYVKLHKDLEEKIRERRYRDANTMPLYWLEWDFDLQNGQGNVERKAKQRECVGKAVREIIDVTLGTGHGWTCESDASLKEWALTEPPDVRKWCMYCPTLPPIVRADTCTRRRELRCANHGKLQGVLRSSRRPCR